MASNSRQRSASSGSTRPRGQNNPRYANARPASEGRVGRAAPGPAPAPGRASSRPAPSAPRGVTSVRIGDIDRMERAQARAQRSKEARAASRKPLIVLSVVVCLIVAALIAFLVLSRSSVFAIESIDVVGAEHLTSAEVSALVSVPQGKTLLDVDTEAIKSSLLRDSWVKSVTVNRVFPSTLQIVVTERQISAVVEIPMGKTQTIQNWAIASDGMWLMAIPSKDSEIGQSISPKIYEDSEAALHITGVPYGLEPEIGAYCADDNVNNALAIVDGMTTDLAGRVKAVEATDAESTLLTLDNNIEIAFGTADDIREKERVCLKIMEQNPLVVYINVRVVDRPTWRAA